MAEFPRTALRVRGEGRGEGLPPHVRLAESPPHPALRADLSPQAGRGDPKSAPIQPEATLLYRSTNPVAASSSAMACGALATLMVVMPISRAGFRLTPRSSR